MAGKTDAEKGKGKGVAFAKWAKIDRAQRNMFLAVCGASVVLGVTIVFIIYFIKVISFNATLIREKDSIIADYKDIQKSLDNIAVEVSDLTKNDNLEVVARTRSDDCSKYTEVSLDGSNEDDIEIARTCSSLRVIPDAIPSSENVEATLASLNQLLLWSDNNLEIKGISGTEIVDPGLSSSSEESTTSSLSVVGVSLSLDDDATKVRNAMDKIEDSIRNYDIASAQIDFSEDDEAGVSKIKFDATYRAYYSTPVSLDKKKKKVCASKDSEKCTGKKASKK